MLSINIQCFGTSLLFSKSKTTLEFKKKTKQKKTKPKGLLNWSNNRKKKRQSEILHLIYAAP